MDARTMLRERRSVRSFAQEKVDREVMSDIIETASYSPTWANFQISRYTIVDDEAMKKRIGDECYDGFKGNKAALESAAGVLVLSYVNGKSGHSPKGDVASPKGDTWSMFDAGIASLQFCLAAYEKGIGTVIQGLFNEEKLAELINLPDGEIIAAVIPYGYEEKHPKAAPRKPLEEIMRFM